jgi:transcriptional regulator with XRE-family HTH domain
MSISERIVYIQQQEGISASKFADLLGVQRSGLSHIYSGRNKPSIDFLQKLSSQFPKYSLEWIINGEEPILKSQIKPQKEQIPDLFNQSSSDVINNDNHANYGLNSDQTELNDIPKYIENQKLNEQQIILKEIILIYSDNTFKILKPQNDK